MEKEKRKNEWEIEGEEGDDRKGRLVGAAILIGLGLLFLLMNFAPSVDFGRLILIGMGGIFLAAGAFTRNVGFVIPGCILAGIGVGVWLVGDRDSLDGLDNGAVILLSMGLGFCAITPLSRLVGNETHWWALIPGGILCAIGLLIGYGDVGISILEQVGRFWPVILIAVGLFILLRGKPKEE